MVEHLVHFALNDIHSQACMVLLGEQDLHAALELLQQSAALLPAGIESWRADKAARATKLLTFFRKTNAGKVLWQRVELCAIPCPFPQVNC